jgi:ribosome-associated toxin RatA of RatAB toxin-antitoxin module
MLEVKLSTILGKSADCVWQTIGDFNALPEWHPWVTASVLEPAAAGIGRRVTIDGGRAGLRQLTERLVSFDALSRRYSYTVVAGSVPFQDYVGHFSVNEAGADRCRFEFIGRFAPAVGCTDNDAVERVTSFYRAAVEHLPNLFGR